MEHIISLLKLLLLSPRWYATDHEGMERKRERRRRAGGRSQRVRGEGEEGWKGVHVAGGREGRRIF